MIYKTTVRDAFHVSAFLIRWRLLRNIADDILAEEDEPQILDGPEEGGEDEMMQDDSLYCFRQHSGDCP